MSKKEDKKLSEEQDDLTSIDKLSQYEHPLESITPPETELTISEEVDLSELDQDQGQGQGQDQAEEAPAIPETVPEITEVPDAPELPDFPEIPEPEPEPKIPEPENNSFSFESMVNETMSGYTPDSEPIEEETESLPPMPSPPPPPPPPIPKAEKVDQVTLSLKEIQTFGDNVAYGDIDILSETAGPHFSVLVKNIQYEEDAKAIFKILSEYKLTLGKEDLILKSLQKGHLIVSHINEYSAIFLAHKLRRFEADIGIGYSDEIHPSKIYESKKGLTYKRSLVQNKSEIRDLENLNEYNEDSILLTTTPSIEGKKIDKYIGITSDFVIVNNDDTENMDELYLKLSLKLRPKAFKLKGNAVVGISYQLVQMENEQFKLICTGSVVWIS